MRSAILIALVLFAAAAAQAGPVVTFTVRDLGAFEVRLHDDTPLHRDNFLRYVQDGLLDEEVIHRSDVGNQVIQGGGFRRSADPNYLLEPIPSYAPVPYEAHLGGSNVKWSFGAARTSDPNSATSGWYVNMGDNSAGFDHTPTSYGYTVFGTVIDGFETLEAIWGLNRWNFGSDTPLTTTPLREWYDGSTYAVYDDFVIVETVTVPEPAGLTLLGLSAAGVLLRRRRRA